MKDIKKKLKAYALEADEVLESLFKDEEEYIAKTLISSMKYTLFSGGKRLRPILTRMVAEMLDANMESALQLGAAIEMIHTYSLIHDDLPSMDDDKYRRGKETNHRVYGPGIAILAGDGLLTYAFNVLSKLPLAADKIIKIIELVSEGAGIEGMVGGQVLDLEAENKAISLEEMKAIHRAKTGALFRTSILAAAYCGETSKKEIEALEIYAENLGLTFQITDDILDVIGNEEKLGKKTGSDEKLDKSTYPKLLGLEGAKKEARKNAELAKEAIDIFDSESQDLKDLIDFILSRQS
ncbi:polyprenyl synthetase family protein [Natronospora cellulosivora (SeqCode)]